MGVVHIIYIEGVNELGTRYTTVCFFGLPLFRYPENKTLEVYSYKGLPL